MIRGEIALVIATPPRVAQLVVLMSGPTPKKIQYSVSGSAVQVMMTEPSPGCTRKSAGGSAELPLSLPPQPARRTRTNEARSSASFFTMRGRCAAGDILSVHGLEVGVPRLPEEESPAIGGALLRLRERAAHAVAALVFEAHEHGLAAGGGRGHARAGLQGHPDVHAGVVDSVLEDHGGQLHPGLHVRVGAVGEQSAELVLFLHRAVLGDVAGAVGAELRAHLVGVAHA